MRRVDSIYRCPVRVLYFLGLKFISKRIFENNVLQLTHITFFSLLMTLRDQPLTVEWRSAEWQAGVRGGNPAQYVVVSQMVAI